MNLEEFAKLRSEHGTLRAVQRATGMTWHAVQKLGKATKEMVPEISEGSTEVTIERSYRELPEPGQVNRFIVSAIQNNTKVHKPFLQSLQQYAEHLDAEIILSPFSYNKKGYKKHGGNAPKTGSNNELGFGFDPSVPRNLICNARVTLAPTLEFCGELDISPTSVAPLSGLHEYTKGSSGIVPHARRALVSVATMKHKPAKLMYTTGAVTKLNYIARKAGQKAEFHHCFGALIVEVDSDGNWWCRQITTDSSGCFYDLENFVTPKGLADGKARPTAVVLGDIHAEKQDDLVWLTTREMLYVLGPGAVVVHDLVDFGACSPHDVRNHAERFEKWTHGKDRVDTALDQGRRALCHLRQELKNGQPIHVVESNHDRWLDRWLDRADYRADPHNARTFLRLALEQYNAIACGRPHTSMLKPALFPGRDTFKKGIDFVPEGDSLEFNSIECGLHGDLGTNGARGGLKAFSKIGPKTFVAHTHSAGIEGGAWQVGVTGCLEMGYNKGPSSWSHTHGLVYPDGERCLITIPANRKMQWRAA